MCTTSVTAVFDFNFENRITPYFLLIILIDEIIDSIRSLIGVLRSYTVPFDLLEK